MFVDIIFGVSVGLCFLVLVGVAAVVGWTRFMAEYRTPKPFRLTDVLIKKPVTPF